MKKSLFLMAAASALMLTACTSEDDVLQSSAPQKAEAKALGFDVYLPQAANVTRAGDPEGVMTTAKLKTADKGFGVFAMYTGNADYTTGDFTPNFMYNEHIHWASGWTYSPLKYWPNETTNDSQDPAATADDLDRLSFFAYAPYVGLTTPGTMTTERYAITGVSTATKDANIEASPSTGILAITQANYKNDPLVEWKASSNPDHNVDLLWGVAPAGLSYTSVKGSACSATYGFPITNMVKPDKDQQIKFLFQHALSRIGLSVVSAIDQIAAGDDAGKFNTDETRVLIDEVLIYGNFGTQGVLNLNNPDNENEANWIETSVNRVASTAGTPLFTINSANGYLNPALRYDASQITAIASDASAFASLNQGVLASEQDLMIGGADLNKTVTAPIYGYGTTFYTKSGDNYVVANAKTAAAAVVYEKDGSDNYSQVYDGSGTGYEVDGSKQYYTLAETTSGTVLEGGTYYAKSSTTYTKKTAGSGGQALNSDNVTLVATPVTATYAAGTYYTGARYFMVIPSALPAVENSTETTINVKITYHVVTKDTKLTGNVSDVSNAITRETAIQLKNGKSYNLKLILGLTSVKLDATVADWRIADDAEVYLPKNNE